MTKHEELLRAYQEAKDEFEVACEMDSGDEFSHDWLSATAGILEQAKQALDLYEKINK